MNTLFGVSSELDPDDNVVMVPPAPISTSRSDHAVAHHGLASVAELLGGVIDVDLQHETGFRVDDGLRDSPPKPDEVADDFGTLPEPPGEFEQGSNEADIISGGGGDDTLHGASGDDIMQGFGGEDEMHGDVGADTMNGGAAQDTLHGGPGDDSLTGGGGADVFAFSNIGSGWLDLGLDVITDMDLSEDRFQFLHADVFAFFDPEGGSALADVLTALPGNGGAELWAEMPQGLKQIAFLVGVEADALLPMIADESILA